MHPEQAPPGPQNLAARLEAALPPGHLALLKTIAATAGDGKIAIYLVGGFVRDLLLDHPGLDFDLVVEGDAIALAKTLAMQHGGHVTTHGRFGTAKWQLAGLKLKVEGLSEPSTFNLPTFLDLITARSETYTHPTALPTVEPGSIQLDLQRRDFTINTLALRLDDGHYGELLDLWGGLADLRQGLIRVLHPGSFVDDPTRLLRAVRFEQRFGFQIEPGTLALIPAALPLLARVSGDRIRHELDYTLDEPTAPAILARLDALGILAAIDPNLLWNEPAQLRILRLRSGQVTNYKLPDPSWNIPPDFHGAPLHVALSYLLWLIALPVDLAQQVALRLKMTEALKAALLDACSLWDELLPMGNASPFDMVQGKPSELTARFDRAAPLAVYAVFLTTADTALRGQLQMWAQTWRHIRPTLTGHDLQARGLPPGPAYKTILTALRTAWLDGKIMTEAEELSLFEELIGNVKRKT